MREFRYDSAIARCYPVNADRVMRVAYSGVLCAKGYYDIAPQIIDETPYETLAILVDLTRCTLLMDDVPQLCADVLEMAICWIVRPDQLKICNAFAASSARVGAQRLIFLESQRNLADEWLSRNSARHALSAPVF